MKGSVSVIVPSYNSHGTIGSTFLSILEQQRFDDIGEIIIVDSSDDGKTTEFLAGLKHEKLRIEHLTQKTIAACARNIGAGIAGGDLLCFIDSDVTLSREWLGRVLEAHRKGCRVGGGSVGLPDFQKNNPLAKAQLYLQFNEYLDTGKPQVRKIIPACNMVCERRVFERVGGFPELRASEDTAFCLGLSGEDKPWFLPEARCFHIFRQQAESFLKNQEMLGKYVCIYRRMYYDRWFYKGVMPLLLFPAFLIIKIFRIVSRILKAGGQHRRQFLTSLGFFFTGIAYWSLGFIKGCVTHEDFQR